MTDRYAVFGNPVSHSKSPLIHRMFAAQTGEDISYEALLAPLDDFAGAIADFVANGGRGANITVPFKEQAFNMAHARTPRAEAAGAANTLVFHSDNSIYADNTDGVGLLRDITGNLATSIQGKRVLLIGAGGAARGVVLPLLGERPACLTIINRTAAKASELAKRFTGFVNVPLTGQGLDSIAGQQFDIVINATSSGLADETLPIPADCFAPGALAYDMMYGKQTPFLALAASAGARCADGLGMLVEQAATAFSLWRGVKPDAAAVIAHIAALDR